MLFYYKTENIITSDVSLVQHLKSKALLYWLYYLFELLLANSFDLICLLPLFLLS